MNNTDWTAFLNSQGAHWDHGVVTHFGDSTNDAPTSNPNGDTHILCDLSRNGLISVTGADAATFLQNQFCNDVRNVTPSLSQLNAYCTPKGRILAFFRLFQRDDAYYLRLPREILEPTLKRLRMFVLMSKVTLEDASDTLVRIGFSGPKAGQLLGEYVNEVPATTDAVSHDGLSIICIQPGTRFEIIGDAAAVSTLWTKLSDQATPVSDRHWELQDIQAGIPEVVTETQEAFVPQMLNLQAINALSFKKGCYPGQEIVARMHYLGKLKRRMFLAHIADEVSAAAGDPLFAEDSTSGQGVGKVVRAQPNPDGGTDLLAVIELSSAEQQALRLNNIDGPLLKLLELPYMLDEAQ
jgi:folate-binding protein YgfZ